jgi:hypothetical protein
VVMSAPSKDFQARDDLPPLLYVSALEGGQAAAAYGAATRASDGARKDTLTLGDPLTDGPFLRAMIKIGGASTARPALFFVEIARQAAEIGQAVARAANPQDDAATGPTTLYSEVALDAGGRQRACLGFRFNGGGGIDLTGLACGGVGQSLQRGSLECLISRIEPTSAGAAAGIDKLLKSSSVRKSDC